MQKINTTTEHAIKQWQSPRKNIPLLCYASELMESLGFLDNKNLTATMNRSFQACVSLNISIEENFVPVYRSDGNALVSDWKLSPLACYLLTVNGDPANPNVAKAQLFFALKIHSHVKI